MTAWPPAIFSPCRTWRYQLHRDLVGGLAPRGRLVAFVMLNPSTADERVDDPTIRRCTSFARREGGTDMLILNLFAYCSPSPADLLKVRDPVGPRNDWHLRSALPLADLVIAAWGGGGKAHGLMRERCGQVEALIPEGRGACLGWTKSGGAPRHPLYVRSDAPLHPWPAPF